MKSVITLMSRRAIVLILIFTLTAAFMPASAFADEDRAAKQVDYATVLQSDESSEGESFLEVMDTVVACLITADPQTAGQEILTWSSGKLMAALFGDVGEEKEATLEDVLQSIDKLNTAIGELQTTLDSQQLDDVLNSLKPLLSYGTTYDVYNSLRDIDDKQDSGVYSEDAAKRRVQSELTTSLGNGELDNITSLATVGSQSSYDRFAELLWSAMTEQYHVTISGKTRDMTLMQIWYEHLRYKYHWEHQAYKEWSAFQSQCVILLSTTLSLEKASLLTRIKLIQKWNDDHPGQEYSEGSCESRLKTVQDHINQMAGYQGKGTGNEEVNYPGLFSRDTWDKTYWLYKTRDENLRYYWTPGHEVLLFAVVNTQDTPAEHDNAGFANGCVNYGISVREIGLFSCNLTVKPHHWRKFLHYSGPGSDGNDLISADQLRDMYKDYGKKKHLYDIFINPKEGNFTGLDEEGVNKWWFVVDPDSDHEVYFDKVFMEVKGTVRCYVLSSSSASEDTAALETYTYSTAWRNKSRHFIGIGVKRYGPETSDYGAVVPKTDPKNHTGMRNNSALWWPSRGDLKISYDSESQGNVVSADMDGDEIDKASYSVNEGEVVLSEAYMNSLDFGSHRLDLTCEHGSHTVTFYIRQNQSIGVKSTINKTFGDADFNLGAVPEGDGELTYRSSNKKVAMIDADGDVVLKGAGTAEITVIASETDDYAPAVATVTLNVAKRANPLTVKGRKATIKYSKLKKKDKALAVTKVITFTRKINDRKTYTLQSAKSGGKSYNKYFKINKTTGKVTVKKGLKKGTYKVTIKVKASGNSNYDASALKTVTCKIKVS